MPNEKDQEDKINALGVSVRELFLGGGLFVYGTGLALGGIWWAAQQDAAIAEIRRDHDRLERQVDGLDNVTLGNRITSLETQARANSDRLAQMDGKFDRIIDRLSNSHP